MFVGIGLTWLQEIKFGSYLLLDLSLNMLWLTDFLAVLIKHLSVVGKRANHFDNICQAGKVRK